jgi:hypothetical protein
MMASNSTASSSSLSSAGAGITGGYEGDSLTLKVLMAFFLGLSIYNVLELQVLIFGTFSRYKGLYFWSLLIAGWGIVPYSVGFLLKLFGILHGRLKWLPIALLIIGWYPMITGQVCLHKQLNAEQC